MPPDLLFNRLDEIRTRIASAALRYGRLPESVVLVAISKGQPAASLRQLAAAGQFDFGENYLQEALPKLSQLADLRLTWHFTGQLQGNKTRAVAENFAWVHTLDRERIAIRLNEQRPPEKPPLNVCIQVKLAEEPGKGGIDPRHLEQLALRVSTLPRLKLRGLMCIPPHVESRDEQLEMFRRLAVCHGQLRSQGLAVDTLSMGMSADLESAIHAGSTMVRIGTALFGERAATTS